MQIWRKRERHFFSGTLTGKSLMVLQITLSKAPLNNSNYTLWSNSNPKKNRSRRETYLEKERQKWTGNEKECSGWIGSKLIKILTGVVKSTCSGIRSRFRSQHSHLISQPPITQVPGIWSPLLTFSSTNHAHETPVHMQIKHWWTQNKINLKCYIYTCMKPIIL